MPRYIMKVSKDPNIDLYVEWSTVVDAPVAWGRAQDLGLSGERKRRTDQHGTSMYDGYGGWDSNGMIVHNLGTKGGFYWLKRENLEQFIRMLSDGNPEDAEHQQKVLDATTDEITD